jgi:hypothetical protein
MDHGVSSAVRGDSGWNHSAIELEDNCVRVHLCGVISENDVNGAGRCDSPALRREGVDVGLGVGEGGDAQIVHPLIVKKHLGACPKAELAAASGGITISGEIEVRINISPVVNHSKGIVRIQLNHDIHPIIARANPVGKNRGHHFVPSNHHV